MIKHMYIAECDLCGKVKPAKLISDGYHDDTYDLPCGWGYAHNKDFTLCPECLSLRGGDNSVESNSEGRE